MIKDSFFYSLGAIIRNSVRMHPDHFNNQVSYQSAKKLIKEHVEIIEFETTSYCNRICSFCPNSFIDRRSQKNTMHDSVWKRILIDLKELDYEGMVLWSGYSEALSEPTIVSRIKKLRIAAPKSWISINTNGDYLTKTLLNDLEKSGLSGLWIDLYLCDEENYNLDTVQKKFNNLIYTIDRKYKLISIEPEISYQINSCIQITCTARNYSSIFNHNMTNRGGSIKMKNQHHRVSPCFAPFKHIVIDWDGSVVICCQVRSDNPIHKHTIVANITKEEGLIEAYVKLSDWRKSLKTYGTKKYPCSICNAFEYNCTWPIKIISLYLTVFNEPTSFLIKKFTRPLLSKRIRY